MKSDTLIYQGKEESVYDLLKRFGIHPDRYSYRRRQGMSVEVAFYDCLKLKKKSTIKDAPVEVLNNLRQRGLPERFISLSQFCLWARIDYSTFDHLCCQYPSYSISQVYREYLKLEPCINSVSHIYYGVSLRAMCIKFQLSCEYCEKVLRQNPNVSLLELFQKAIIQTLPLPIQSFLKKIGGISNAEELEEICMRYRIGDNAKHFLLSYLQRMNEITTALSIYQMVYFFEEGWMSLYENDILALQENTTQEKYVANFRKLKHRVFEEQRKKWNLNSRSVSHFYQQYYQDYLPSNSQEFGVRWGYNRKLTRFSSQDNS